MRGAIVYLQVDATVHVGNSVERCIVDTGADCTFVTSPGAGNLLEWLNLSLDIRPFKGTGAGGNAHFMKSSAQPQILSWCQSGLGLLRPLMT